MQRAEKVKRGRAKGGLGGDGTLPEEIFNKAFLITPPLSGSPNCITLAIHFFVRRWP